MPPLLMYVLSAAIVAITVALLPLLGQLQRTAASAERFLDSAKDDVRRIQEDVRATRERIDALAGSAQGAGNRRKVTFILAKGTVLTQARCPPG